MSDYVAAIEALRGSDWEPKVSLLLEYLKTGDDKVLKRLAGLGGLYPAGQMAELLPAFENLTVAEKRALKAEVVTNWLMTTWHDWFLKELHRAPDRRVWLEQAVKSRGFKDARRVLGAMLAGSMRKWFLKPKGSTEAEEDFLLALSDADWVWIGKHQKFHRLFDLLVKRDTARLARRAADFLDRDSSFTVRYCEELLQLNFKANRPVVDKLFRDPKMWPPNRFAVGCLLAAGDRGYLKEVRDLAHKQLTDPNAAGAAPDNCLFLTMHFGVKSLTQISDYLRTRKHLIQTGRVLHNLYRDLGTDSLPAVLAACDNPDWKLRVQAIELLVRWPDRSARGKVEGALVAGLRDKDKKVVARCIPLAAEWDAARFREQFEELAKSKAKTVQVPAAAALKGVALGPKRQAKKVSKRK